MEKIIIIGGGGHARVLIDMLQLSGQEILGYTDLENFGDLEDVAYLGRDEDLKTKYPSGRIKLVNGIGSVRLPVQRRAIYEKFKKLGYTFLTVQHPKAVVARNVRIGEGAQIMSGAIINPGTEIGNNVIINTSASVDHDCKIGDHTHVAPGVTISGGVTIGQSNHIGIGANIIQGIHIGERNVIGAGTLVLRNVGSEETIFGIPGQVYEPKEVR